ncbi:MAG: HEAT repeat domain-containing protein [Planctomycetota bacterium]|jgi:HEAT repeat protein
MVEWKYCLALFLMMFAAGSGSVRADSIDVLFGRVLAADPCDYAARREVIVGKGDTVLDYLEKRRKEASNWYEQAMADALVLAISSPGKYQEYQKELEKCRPSLPEWGGRGYRWRRPDPHDRYEGLLAEQADQAHGFLIEALCKETTKKIPNPTWTRPQSITYEPFDKAARVLMDIGGKEAARAIAVIILEGKEAEPECPYFCIGQRKGPTINKFSSISDYELIKAMIRLVRRGEWLPSAAWVLGEFRDPNAIDPLIDSMVGHDVRMYSSSATALAKMGPAAVPALLETLGGSRQITASWAATALRRMSERRGAEIFFKFLKSKDADTVSKVAKVLGEIGDPAAIEPLWKALDDPKNVTESGTTLYRISEALTKFKDEHAFDRVAKLARHDNAHIRMPAIEALAVVGAEKSLPILLGLLKDKDAGIRLRAAKALGKLADQRAVPALIEALSDPVDSVYLHAARALGEIGDARALDHLWKKARQTDGHHHKTIRGAIRKIEARQSDS